MYTLYVQLFDDKKRIVRQETMSPGRLLNLSISLLIKRRGYPTFLIHGLYDIDRHMIIIKYCNYTEIIRQGESGLRPRRRGTWYGGRDKKVCTRYFDFVVETLVLQDPRLRLRRLIIPMLKFVSTGRRFMVPYHYPGGVKELSLRTIGLRLIEEVLNLSLMESFGR